MPGTMKKKKVMKPAGGSKAGNGKKRSKLY